MKTYLFRREDSGEVVEVDFAAMFQQDVMGYITLPDGVQGRRCVNLEIERDAKPKPSPVKERDKPIVSDALGFGEHQLADFEADRQAYGFRDVEFTRDPQVPQFFQVKCSSRRAWERYVRHRGMADRNSRNGGAVVLSDEQMQAAEARARERYPVLTGVIC